MSKQLNKIVWWGRLAETTVELCEQWLKLIIEYMGLLLISISEYVFKILRAKLKSFLGSKEQKEKPGEILR